ncbi:DUF1819 domain-containing protein [Lactobacillus acidophilus]|uniref:DUF1819 family protein n=1 Tax=Lactobacillus acidophilus TaxID=1579 RepID=UPI000F763BE8|nr:DUF1819 family protein [Lactobacillus acidophilus]AZN76639.1 DUF1819 domain-containing protein [Lactobacillus acidophilus]
MTRTYNGGIASYAIWLPEFTKFVELYEDGKSIAEIKQLSDDENIFQMSTPARARRCSRNLALRIKKLPDSIVDLYPRLNPVNQNLVALISVMLTSRILDEFIYEVYRPKAIIHNDTLQDYEIEAFFNNKRIESDTVANWSLKTIKRLKGAVKTYLRDAGLMTADNKLLFPFIDSQLVLLMKKEGLDYELAALGGI